MAAKKTILCRVVFIYFGVGFLGAGIIGKAVYTQIHDGAELKKQQAEISESDIIIEPIRGDILASDGRVLATSVPYYEIRMDTRSGGLTDEIFNANIDSLAFYLSKIPGKKSADAYKQAIVKAREQKNRYFAVCTKVDYIQLKKIKRYPIFRLGGNKGGLIIISDDKREQPHAGLAGRTIGYLTKDPFGNFPGLEGAYDGFLRGTQGVRMMQRLPGGVYMPVSGGNSVEPVEGGDVVSTIDVDIQDVAETSLRKCLIKHNAHHGSAVVMEVATGEVKAIVNLGKSGGGYAELYNYALGEAVEPGSTFKLMSYMVALEDRLIQMTDSVNNGNGEVFYHGKKVHDDYRTETLGWLSVEKAFAVSSNVSVTKIIDKHYKGKEKKFVDRLYSMNLNNKLNLDLNGEGEPNIKYPDNKTWSGLTLTQMTYGYEVLLAPIHTLTFYNAVANNGKMVKPRFVKELRRHGALEEQKDVEVIKSSIASSATIRTVKQMMEAVVTYGTAKRIKTDLYKIAGKTGTAQIANEKYGYTRDKQHYASFVGYFPADRPKYSCIVTVYAPIQNGTGGGVVAAPVFREISDKIFAADPYMSETLKPAKKGMMTDIPFSKSGAYTDLLYVLDELNIPVKEGAAKTEWVSATGGEKALQIEKRIINKKSVPNVVDMGLKDALFLLEECGLQVSVRGRGRIVSQSLAAGSELVKNRTIVLEMSQE
ncbi:MAG: transpeptidase family protein [Bacteroidales bacterium]|jgi:cell division protein FtsI (penicillin-binding protein 3)|nr:transpeptidase family protein [Bacteroidales bacterium]